MAGNLEGKSGRNWLHDKVEMELGTRAARAARDCVECKGCFSIKALVQIFEREGRAVGEVEQRPSGCVDALVGVYCVT